MPPGLRPLGNDRSCAGFDRFINLSQRLHLANQLRAALSNPPNKRSGIAEGQKHAIGRIAEHFIEHVGHACQRPSDETYAELVALNMCQFLFEIRLAADNARIAPTDDSQPARVRYGGRQATTGNERHRGANDWVPDSERVSQPRSHLDLLGLVRAANVLVNSGPTRRQWQVRGGRRPVRSTYSWAFCYKRLRPSKCPRLMVVKSTPSKHRALMATMYLPDGAMPSPKGAHPHVAQKRCLILCLLNV